MKRAVMTDLQPLTGEKLALDLVNTRPLTEEGPVDLIGSLDGLRNWLALEAGRLPGFSIDDAEGLGADDLAAVLSLRGHAAALIEAARKGGVPEAGALEGLNAALRAAPAVRVLARADSGFVSGEMRMGTAGARLAAALAEAAADLLGDPACAQVRQCAAEDCTMLFLPAHPRRQWCSSARCGNRARVARYYKRHKGE